MRSATASIASHVRLWLAPGATAMQFSPSCETKISAVPVGVSLAVKRASVLMPSAANCCRRAAAPASSPRHETKATSPPRRAAATAWLAPLPPLDCMKRASPTVSPGRGRCLTQAIMSMLVLPITRILFMFGYRWLISVVFRPAGSGWNVRPAEMLFFRLSVDCFRYRFSRFAPVVFVGCPCRMPFLWELWRMFRFSDAIFLALFALIVCANIITFWKPPKLFCCFSFLSRYFSYICHR